jgi:serpin B
MMGLTGEELNYAEKDGAQILEMAYEGEDLSMMLILPVDNDLESVEETLTPEKISEWKEALVEQSVDVFVPKFSLKTRYSMKDTLTDMGMPTAFSADADLSGMNGYGGLVIGKVIHQAFIEVNEEGSEAAVATAVIVLRSAQKTPVFRADHPFIFLIQRGDNILFMGRGNDPTA